MIAKLKAWWAALWSTEETKVETDVKTEEQKVKV